MKCTSFSLARLCAAWLRSGSSLFEHLLTSSCGLTMLSSLRSSDNNSVVSSLPMVSLSDAARRYFLLTGKPVRQRWASSGLSEAADTPQLFALNRLSIIFCVLNEWCEVKLTHVMSKILSEGARKRATCYRDQTEVKAIRTWRFKYNPCLYIRIFFLFLSSLLSTNLPILIL